MAQLQEEIGQTVFLGVLDNDGLLYIDKIEDADSVITFTSKIGTRHPSHWGMCGPLLMAYLSDSEVERLLGKTPLHANTKKSITDKEEFKAWLRQIRKQGFAIDREATFEGITGVASPVRDFRRELVASVGIALMTSCLDLGDVGGIVHEALKTAETISRELGYKP